MPKINVKLASQSLAPARASSASISSRGVSAGGGMVSSQAGQVSGNVQAPYLNPTAANVDYKPLKPNDIVVDTSLDALAQAADVFTKSAFNWQDRQDQLAADELVTAYRDEIRRSQIGYKNKDGKWVRGYTTLEGKDALDTFDGHRNNLESKFKSFLQSQPENVRQKALLRMNNDRNSALARAVEHNATQFAAVEKQQLYMDHQSLLKEIESYGDDPWNNGAIASYLAKFDTPEERDTQAHLLGQFTLREAYNRTLNLTESPEKAYAATEVIYEVVKPYLAENGEQELDWWLGKRKEEASKAERKRIEDRRKVTQEKLKQSAPYSMADMAAKSNFEGIGVQAAALASTYKAENYDDAIEDTSEALISSVKLYIDQPVYETPADRLDAAIEFYEGMVSSEAYKGFDPFVRTQFEEFFLDDVHKHITDRQKAKDAKSSMSLAHDIAVAEKAGVTISYQEPPKGMLPENRDKWNNIFKNHVKGSAAMLNAEMSMAKETAPGYFRGKIIATGPLNTEDQEVLWNMVEKEVLSSADYVNIIAESERVKANAPKYRTSPGFLQVKTNITSAINAGLFDVVKEKPKDKYELTAFEMNRANVKYQALYALDEAVNKAAAANTEFDYVSWWSEYLKDYLNKGGIVNPDIFDYLPDWLPGGKSEPHPGPAWEEFRFVP